MQTYKVIGSIGIKNNRPVGRRSTATRTRLTNPTMSDLKALGYNTKQAQRILDLVA
jgi:hypothetical protein